jgi:hypothetical protein
MQPPATGVKDQENRNNKGRATGSKKQHDSIAFEQDLSGCISDSDLDAFEEEQFLPRFKSQLEQEYNVQLRMPSWVN